MSVIFEWWRDVPRYESVRAAEDAANWRRLEVGEVVQAGDEHRNCWGWKPVPTAWYGQMLGDGFWPLRRRIPSAPQHRDLPEVVAALTERVARLEAAQATIGSGDVFADVGCGSTGDEIARLTAERDAAIRGRDEARAEIEEWSRRCARVLDERDALREKIVVMEGQSRMETEAEIAVEEAWERCGIAPHWPDDEPGTSHRYAESMRMEIVRLRARVAELENAAAAQPIGWIARHEQSPPNGKYVMCRWDVSARQGYAREVGYGVAKRGPDGMWRAPNGVEKIAPMHWMPLLPGVEGGDWWEAPPVAAPAANAGGEQQEPRGWLTRLERWRLGEIVKFLKSRAEKTYGTTGGTLCGAYAADLDDLIARSTLRVKVPHLDDLEADERPVWQSACEAWIAAIRAAGGEVEG